MRVDVEGDYCAHCGRLIGDERVDPGQRRYAGESFCSKTCEKKYRQRRARADGGRRHPPDDEHNWFTARKRPMQVWARVAKETEHLDTANGPVTAKPGDLVVRQPGDDPYPVARDVFDRTYDIEPGRDVPPPPEPEVVCLCGSTKFKEEYREENARLTLAGKIVLSVGFFHHYDGMPDVEGVEDAMDEGAEWKRDVDNLHLRKIDLADRVHVINVAGYVGSSTTQEVRYAHRNGVPVTWLEPDRVPEDLRASAWAYDADDEALTDGGDQ